MKEQSQIIETIKKVMPTVVSIVITKSLEEVEKEIKEMAPPIPEAPIMNIPPDKIDANGMVQVGGGSGFIIQENGTILTNKHVIAEPRANYTVITNSDTRYNAEIIARDPINDVAILKIEPKEEKLPTIELGDSRNLELGQTVIAIGNALGIFKNTVSCGVISGLSRSISAQADPRSPMQEMRGLIQTDAAINPGNSGGPLVDIFGRIIGINAAIILGAQNISFAIPISAAERDLNDLKKFGKIRRPLLGLRYLAVNADMKEKMKLQANYGALVIGEHPMAQAIVPKSPAYRGGIKEMDLILEWNGEKITMEKNIQDYLENCNVGDIIKLKILRGGREVERRVVLAERK